MIPYPNLQLLIAGIETKLAQIDASTAASTQRLIGLRLSRLQAKQKGRKMEVRRLSEAIEEVCMCSARITRGTIAIHDEGAFGVVG